MKDTQLSSIAALTITFLLVFSGHANSLPVTLIEPANGAILTTLAPTFTINLQKGGDVMAGEFQIASDANFRQDATGAVLLDNGDNARRFCINLRRSTKYYYRARAWHGTDMNDPTYGDWTTVRTFTTGDGSGVPAAPELIAPTNGAWGTRYRRFMDLSWTAPGSDIQEYALFLYQQGDQGESYTLRDDITTTISAQPGIVYYWWVRARNSAGWGPLTGYRHFIMPVWEPEHVQQEPIEDYVPPQTWRDQGDPQPGAVPNDFDGDGLSDPWDMRDGIWTVWLSDSDYDPRIYNLGVQGTPVLADFDGDGNSDPAVVDAAGNWHAWLSGQNYQYIGAHRLFPADVTGLPTAADADGNGKADPMIADGGFWHLCSAAENYQCRGALNVGLTGIPAPADYDGDGRPDPATLDGNGNWQALLSSQNYAHSGPHAFGIPGTPRPGDYDGDGKADPAVIDGNGNWYFWLSGNNYTRSGPHRFTTDGNEFTLTQDVITIEASGFTYNFKIYRPDMPGAFPGVMVVGGINAQQLAARGFYVVDCIDGMSEEMLDYLGFAIPELITAMRVRPHCTDHIGATGFSWGGAFVLSQAAETRQLGAVVEVGGLLAPENNIDLTRDIPNPVFFITGENDTLATPDATRAMYDEFLQSGQPADLYIVPGEGHGLSASAWADVLNRAAVFFRQHL